MLFPKKFPEEYSERYVSEELCEAKIRYELIEHMDLPNQQQLLNDWQQKIDECVEHLRKGKSYADSSY